MRRFLILVALGILPFTSSQAQLGDILKKAESAVQQSNTSHLSDSKITAGLKQALQLSTGKAVAASGRPDGFLKNQAIKIVLPEKLQLLDFAQHLALAVDDDDRAPGRSPRRADRDPHRRRRLSGAQRRHPGGRSTAGP